MFTPILCFSYFHQFLPEYDYVTFGYLPSPVRLSSVCNVRAPYSAEGLNAREVAKYSDVVYVKGYISKTVQDKASGMVNE